MRVMLKLPESKRKWQDKCVHDARNRGRPAKRKRIPCSIRPYSGVSVNADAAWSAKHLINRENQATLTSNGILLGECWLRADFSEESIPTVPDPIVGNPAHALADFNSHGVNQRKKKARRLAEKAAKYGAKFLP